MARGGEPAHVSAGLGADDVGDTCADAWDRADQCPEAVRGLDHRLDPVRRLAYGLGVAVDQVQMDPRQERVMFAELSGQRFGQGRDLQAQPTFGQVGQHRRITLPFDEGATHQPMGAQLGQPVAVADVALAAAQVLDVATVTGIDFLVTELVAPIIR